MSAKTKTKTRARADQTGRQEQGYPRGESYRTTNPQPNSADQNRGPQPNSARQREAQVRERQGERANQQTVGPRQPPQQARQPRQRDPRQAGAGRRSGSSSRGRGQDPADVLLSRSFLLGKPVITRTTGTNLGVVNQMWVDPRDWKVVCLDVRENMLWGEQDSVMLDRLRQIGDVVLVHDESDAQRNVGIYGLNYLVGSEVVTETGGYLGKCRDFTFNPEDGQVATIEFDSFGTPVVPSSVLSTYAVNCSEVVSVGPDRIVVAAGAESRVQQLSSGVMQRLALYEPPWEAAYRDQLEMDYYGNQYALPPGAQQYDQQYDYRQDPYYQQRQEQVGFSQQQNPNQYAPPPRGGRQAVPRGGRQGGPTMAAGRGGGPEGQQQYEDFIEVDEREPVYEAQADSKDNAYPARYNREEDRL